MTTILENSNGIVMRGDADELADGLRVMVITYRPSLFDGILETRRMARVRAGARNSIYAVHGDEERLPGSHDYLLEWTSEPVPAYAQGVDPAPCHIIELGRVTVA